jgi:hypothetical protein
MGDSKKSEEKIIYKNTPLTYLFVMSPIILIILLCVIEMY